MAEGDRTAQEKPLKGGSESGMALVVCWGGGGVGGREITISNFSKLADFHLFGGLTNGALRCLHQTTVWNREGRGPLMH